jgi:hypothetical protein
MTIAKLLRLEGNTILQADTDSRILCIKIGQIERTDTTDTNLFVLPDGAVPIIFFLIPVQSSNASTATINVGITGNDGYFFSDYSVTTGGVAIMQASNTAFARASQQVVGIYAESGTPSTVGGPFLIYCFYYVYP